jgi:polysaccharide export outer membrane protein
MKTLERIRILLLLLLGIAMSSQAQNESLLIGPGDLLHLQVYDTPEMEQRARVTDAGSIPFSFLGNVGVAGLTPEQAAKEIEGRLIVAGVMLHPQVTVRVETYATQNVSVMGEVQKPGIYEIDTPHKAVEVLALAGGLTYIADRHLTIQRHGNAKEKV